MAYSDLSNLDAYQKGTIFYNGVTNVNDAGSTTTDVEYLGFYVATTGTVTFTALNTAGDTTVTALPVTAGSYVITPMKNISVAGGGRILLGKL